MAFRLAQLEPEFKPHISWPKRVIVIVVIVIPFPPQGR